MNATRRDMNQGTVHSISVN